MCDLFRHRGAITRATTIRNTAISTDHTVVCNSCEILSETFRPLPAFIPPLSFTFSLISTLLLNIHVRIFCRCIISYCIETIRGNGRACFQLILSIGSPGHALFLFLAIIECRQLCRYGIPIAWQVSVCVITTITTGIVGLWPCYIVTFRIS